MSFPFRLMGFLFKLMGFLFKLMAFLFRLMAFLFWGGRSWVKLVAFWEGLGAFSLRLKGEWEVINSRCGVAHA